MVLCYRDSGGFHYYDGSIAKVFTGLSEEISYFISEENKYWYKNVAKEPYATAVEIVHAKESERALLEKLPK